MKHTPRFFTPQALAIGELVRCDAAQSHHMAQVLRMQEGACVHLFNETHGEYAGPLVRAHKSGCVVRLERLIQSPHRAPALHLCFASLKAHRTEMILEKGTELGVTHFHPLAFEHSMSRPLKMEKAQQQGVHAAQQCGRLDVPQVCAPQTLAHALRTWLPEMTVLLCDLGTGVVPWSSVPRLADRPVALIVGPEGGISPLERAQILALPYACAVSLGPTILRAETAAIAALAILRSLA